MVKLNFLPNHKKLLQNFQIQYLVIVLNFNSGSNKFIGCKEKLFSENSRNCNPISLINAIRFSLITMIFGSEIRTKKSNIIKSLIN